MVLAHDLEGSFCGGLLLGYGEAESIRVWIIQGNKAAHPMVSWKQREEKTKV